MEGSDFDRLVRSLRSRRSVLSVLLGGGVAAGLGRPARAGAVDCLANGEECDPANPAACCTLTCKKHKRKYKCAPAGEAFGCPKRNPNDICAIGGSAGACPGFPAAFCAIARTKRKREPLCLASAKCDIACTSDADCVAHFGHPPTLRCLKHCNYCASGTACVDPVTDS